MTIQIGDCVRLTSGGRQMVVMEVDEISAPDFVTCAWHSDTGTKQSERYHRSSLEKSSLAEARARAACYRFAAEVLRIYTNTPVISDEVGARANLHETYLEHVERAAQHYQEKSAIEPCDDEFFAALNLQRIQP